MLLSGWSVDNPPPIGPWRREECRGDSAGVGGPVTVQRRWGACSRPSDSDPRASNARGVLRP